MANLHVLLRGSALSARAAVTCSWFCAVPKSLHLYSFHVHVYETGAKIRIRRQLRLKSIFAGSSRYG